MHCDGQLHNRTVAVLTQCIFRSCLSLWRRGTLGGCSLRATDNFIGKNKGTESVGAMEAASQRWRPGDEFFLAFDMLDAIKVGAPTSTGLGRVFQFGIIL